MSLSRSTYLGIFVAIGGIVGLLWLAYFYFTLAPVAAQFDLPGTTTSTPMITALPVVIEEGVGLRDISEMLFEKNLVRSASAFKLYALLSGSAHQLKPGLYIMNSASSTPELVRFLVSGPAKEISVLIPEGATLSEIDEILARYGITHAGAILKLRVTDFYDQFAFLRGTHSFEGFLFPDTYRFYFGSSPDKVVRAMLTNYQVRVSPLVTDGNSVNWDAIPITRRGIFSSLEITTIASLIEREVPDSAERKLVSDIIYRRLKLDMPLQIDATVPYAKDHGERYDTYDYYGLPPGPIANPGLDAIDAALNPRSSSYLYYLSDPKTKKTIFSKTFEEHKANKLKYLN